MIETITHKSFRLTPNSYLSPSHEWRGFSEVLVKGWGLSDGDVALVTASQQGIGKAIGMEWFKARLEVAPD